MSTGGDRHGHDHVARGASKHGSGPKMMKNVPPRRASSDFSEKSFRSMKSNRSGSVDHGHSASVRSTRSSSVDHGHGLTSRTRVTSDAPKPEATRPQSMKERAGGDQEIFELKHVEEIEAWKEGDENRAVKETSQMTETGILYNTQEEMPDSAVKNNADLSDTDMKEEAGEDDPDLDARCNPSKMTTLSELPSQETSEAPAPREFDIRKFPSVVSELGVKFESQRFLKVGSDYPVDELLELVELVCGLVDDFRRYCTSSQQCLEELRGKMKTVKDNIHLSTTRKAFEIPADDEYQSVEERELAEKIARLNAEVAKANSELAQVVRFAAETENTAIGAAKLAVQAKEESKGIQEAMEIRAKIEKQRKAEEERRRVEEKRRQEQEERRLEEEKRRKELEWKRRGDSAPGHRLKPWESWPIHAYESGVGNEDFSISCLIRGKPGKFTQGGVTTETAAQADAVFTYGPHEELVSQFTRLTPTFDRYDMEDPIYVAIPYIYSRTTINAREPVIKAEVKGQWVELHTTDVVFENYKDYRFAQAEVTDYCTLAVVTRLRRDHTTFTRRASCMTSSADHRVTLTVPRDTFTDKEHFMMQVQPVDTASINDLKSREISMKGLLTSSAVLYMKWECDLDTEFPKPITVTLPCPPNPAKAKKLAAMRALKEENMKKPQKNIAVPLDEKEKLDQRQKIQEASRQEEEKKKSESRWYMGSYGGNDDDENDNLILLSCNHNGKWSVVPDTTIAQVKLDLLEFQLVTPLEKFMVLRTRQNIDSSETPEMATAITCYLSKRVATVIVKQRNDNLFDTVVNITPTRKLDKVLQNLNDNGYDEGPGDDGHNVMICEGDVIEIGFRGNLRQSENQPITVIYNSHLSTSAQFKLREVDKYLQKNFPVFRGFVQLYRKYQVDGKGRSLPETKKSLELTDSSSDSEQTIEYRRDLLCEIVLTIPKYHIQPPAAPVKAPITIINTTDSVNEEIIHHLAEELGSEWRRLAKCLNIRRTRIQAIMRNVAASDETELDAKFDMLMTWLKKVPKSVNKVDVLGSSLKRCGRIDLAEELRMREKEFRHTTKASTVH